MNLLSAKNLAQHYGEKILFEDLDISLNQGDKIALVANNGTGKSSLLKKLAGTNSEATGEVWLRENCKVGFLSQDPEFPNAHTIEDLLKTDNSEVLAVIRNYEAAVELQTTNYSEESQKVFDRASAQMDKFNAWDYERRMRETLSRFYITDLDQRIDELSGGQKKRLALALVLLDNPEILILDEPTNHLDIDMIEWLEGYLSQNNITFLMVTHDRYFLDRICTVILELTDGRLYKHDGNYGYFLEKRAERETIFATEIDKAGKLMKKELDWIRKSPQARTTKNKARVDAFYRTKEKANSGKKEQDLKLEVKMSRIGGKILELKNVRKSYDDLLILNGFDYTFKKGERIGIVGKNGVGKSTFLNIITQKEKQDSGKINIGDTIIYGYYDQQGIQLKQDKRVLDFIKDIAEVIELGNGSKLSASQFLNLFLFPPEMQRTYVSKLSGGERRRLYLVTVLMKNPNFLILDEPTNDLDLLTLTKLEEFLENYGGCLIIVSHDRYFMDKLVDHLFVFEGNGVIRDFNGTYSEYRTAQIEAEKVEKSHTQKKQKSNQPKVKEKTKLSYKEKLEYETLEKEIPQLEQEKTEKEAELNSGITDYEKLTELSTRVEEIKNLLDEKELRWLELDEFVQ